MSALLQDLAVLLPGEISPFIGDWAGDRPGLDLLDTRITKPRFLDISAQSPVATGWDIPTADWRNNGIHGRIILELILKKLDVNMWTGFIPCCEPVAVGYEQDDGSLLYLLRDLSVFRKVSWWRIVRTLAG